MTPPPPLFFVCYPISPHLPRLSGDIEFKKEGATSKNPDDMPRGSHYMHRIKTDKLLLLNEYAGQ